MSSSVHAPVISVPLFRDYRTDQLFSNCLTPDLSTLELFLDDDSLQLLNSISPDCCCRHCLAGTALQTRAPDTQTHTITFSLLLFQSFTHVHTKIGMGTSQIFIHHCFVWLAKFMWLSSTCLLCLAVAQVEKCFGYSSFMRNGFVYDFTFEFMLRPTILSKYIKMLTIHHVGTTLAWPLTVRYTSLTVSMVFVLSLTSTHCHILRVTFRTRVRSGRTGEAYTAAWSPSWPTPSAPSTSSDKRTGIWHCGGAPALPNTSSNLLHWLGDISAGPECTVEFFGSVCDVFSVVYWFFFFLSILGGVSCSKWLKCVSVWGHVKGEKCLCLSRSVKLWNNRLDACLIFENAFLFLTILKAWVLRESVMGQQMCQKVCLDSGQFTNIDHLWLSKWHSHSFLKPVFTLARNRSWCNV